MIENGTSAAANRARGTAATRHTHRVHAGMRIALAGAIAALATVGSATGAAASPGHCNPLGRGWCAVVRPSSGPVGTRVVLNGRLNPHVRKRELQAEVYNFRHDPHFLFLMRDDAGPPACEVIGGVHDTHVWITNTGRIHGTFIVGGSTSCNHSTMKAPRFGPGVYTVNLECMSCQVDTFTVTPTAKVLPYTGADPTGILALAGVASLSAGTALVASTRRKGAAN